MTCSHRCVPVCKANVEYAKNSKTTTMKAFQILTFVFSDRNFGKHLMSICCSY